MIALVPQSVLFASLIVSAVDSKPASGGRIKTSHFFSFKPVGVVLARGDLRFSGKSSDNELDFDGF